MTEEKIISDDEQRHHRLVSTEAEADAVKLCEELYDLGANPNAIPIKGSKPPTFEVYTKFPLAEEIEILLEEFNCKHCHVERDGMLASLQCFACDVHRIRQNTLYHESMGWFNPLMRRFQMLRLCPNIL